MPAYFRFFTLMVDLAVVEVGIGGAYDCTNIIRKPVVCGISSLGIDHTSLLGDTVEAIAWQKGGIFKRGVPAFTVLQPDGPLAVLRDRAQQISCPLYLCPPLEALEEGGPPLTLGLEGEHQRSNAALALQLARCWLQQKGHQELKMSRPSVLRQMPLAPVFQPTSHMRHGLRDTEWLGRTQTLQRGPLTWYLDGAHTVSSVQACVRWFRQALHRSQRPNRGREVRVLLFNSTGNRDSEALLKLLQPCQFDYAVFCPNLTEVSSASNAGQTVGPLPIRCLLPGSPCDSCGEELGSPGPRLGSPRLLFPLPELCQSRCGDCWEQVPVAVGWPSSVSVEEAWVGWVSVLSSRLPPSPGAGSGCRFTGPRFLQQCGLIGQWSLSPWSWGSHSPGPLGLKVLWGGDGGPHGVPGWCPRWQQASEREAGGVDAEGMVHPWSSGGVGVPG
uniref:tetrahydrofolate synthase n=1 Tax=Neovison vison TaxID=452646 RepID=A0A8C7B0K2_NEOVI